jgi:hypothetical protein
MEYNQPPVAGGIAQTAVITINAPLSTVFTYITGIDTVPRFLQKCGPIAGVQKAVMQQGNYTKAGDWRTLYFTDGTTLREQLFSFYPQTYFSYSISEFTNFVKYLASIAYGEWWFEERESGVIVKWSYTFKPNYSLGKPFLFLFMVFVFKKYLSQTLQLAKADIERKNGQS